MVYRPAQVYNGSGWDDIGDKRIGAESGDIPQASVTDLTSDLASKPAATYSGTAPSSPATGDIWYDTNSTPALAKFWDGSAWQTFSEGPANFSNAATGTYSSGGINYKYVTFTASGTLTVTKAGFADVLVVGGGGGGGRAAGGGGGAGGHLFAEDVYLPAGGLQVRVGAGGAGGVNGFFPAGLSGNASGVGDYIVAPGGGNGGGRGQSGSNGGSGGGAGGSNAPGYPIGNGGAGFAPQGNSGGAGSASPIRSGGGGGANAAGVTGVTSGNGGAGKANSITGSSVTRAGGGGGGSQGGTAGTGGAGGGADGQTTNTTANAGSANTGGGGGGGGFASGYGGAGGSGGSGVIVVRVRT